MDSGKQTHRPAANMLDELPLFTSTAVTGPGMSVGFPTAVQVAFEKLYCATFAVPPSGSVITPPATRNS